MSPAAGAARAAKFVDDAANRRWRAEIDEAHFVAGLMMPPCGRLMAEKARRVISECPCMYLYSFDPAGRGWWVVGGAGAGGGDCATTLNQKQRSLVAGEESLTGIVELG